MPSLIRRTAILTLLLTLPGCESDQQSTRSTLIPTPASGPFPISVRISAPSTIAPGSGAQLSATAAYNDGSSKDVTGSVLWGSSDTSVLTIADAGFASAGQSGDTTVTATLKSMTGVLTATQGILVVPSGTFRLTGRVTWQQRLLEGASVQVTAGTGSGLTSVTGSDGLYRLYGVAGAIELTVGKAGYETIQQPTTITLNTTLSFDMVTTGPLPQFAGDYTLQISADPACAIAATQSLPESARVRQYTATVQDQTSGVRVALSGANFLPHASFLWGYVTPDGPLLDVNHLDYYYGIGYPPPDLGEILPDGNVYSPSGTLTLTASGGGFVGTLNGAIKVWRVPTGADLLGQCISTHHTVTFTKQSANARRTSARR